MNAINKKLTKSIAGRIIKQTSQAEGQLLIEFTDGSLMKIKSSDPAPDCVGRAAQTVKQKDCRFEIVFGDDSSVRLNLAAETSSVMLRDHTGSLEYAD